ncbi:MAG: D-alanyl-D-alanine carboxypeptidase [Clostridia bacterium]|jgi:D-alanyl-D-alanine carboxypeptidase (penicillin-binding protein 5/6)|nr:D-alanyl-D-alanine carboxypeptidase [Clostridia bacterium]
MMRFASKTALILILILLVLSFNPVLAGPKAPEITSEAAVLMDAVSGEIIFAKNENQRWAPASLTKIMTLYLVCEQLQAGKISIQDPVPISEKAWRTSGSKMFVLVDTQVPVEELIKGITIVSGNDACVALAEYIGGTEEEFVRRMNAKARELGLDNTHFVNAHGLGDPDQYSTARDLAFLSRDYLQKFPEMLQYHSTREYEYNGIKQYNRNGLLKYPEIDGLKTGRLSSTSNLIATGKKDDYRLIAVILGADSEAGREKDAYALLNYGFDNYQARKAGEKGQSFGKVRVYKGKGSSVQAVLPEDLFVTILKGETPSIRTELPKYLEAPLAKGEKIGELLVETRDGEKRFPLVAEKDIPRSNFLKVFFHSIWLAIRGLFG